MVLPEIILPQWLGKLVGKLPAKPPRVILVTALNAMLAKELLPADMSLFAGRKFEIDVLDAGVKIRFGANEEKFIADAFEGAPDLRLAANGVDFMRMIMREEDPDTLFFKRKLQIEGDTELGLITKNLLDSVDWPLSRWFLNRDMPQ
ncbi:SCP2 domain-containing protein [Neisseria weixii]|uniref:Ubiquinone biosynthesis accessory factor UbiT n=1 Tax=Neisseria weixii TaxID=1853276 RepID=A0A3N4MZA8_9NEIS|nr:SCP2 sterol-binding domain-containing protein [Neisseria weixii]ATD65608.1 Sterol-binding domain protein [Neisseria weixii]RPD86991.1 Sterol-binding domain protein [Neisseria weixii]RPD87147.1 Sterol-binding domain protein [Neisseria weixii]